MSSYRDRLTKAITLPSGTKTTISKINAFNAPFLEKRVSDDADSLGTRVSKFILLNKVGGIDGLKIVEKVENQSAEIAIDELEQEDVSFIIGEVLAFSGMTSRDEGARKTFPAGGTQNSDNGARPGAAVSGAPSDRPSEVAAG